MNNIAILASGSGTNAEALMSYFKDNNHGRVVLLLSNNSKAYALERAKKFNVPTYTFKDSELRNNTDNIIYVLNEYNVDYIVLAGFLAFIPKDMTDIWENRIINIHPSLLPKYGGKGMYGDRVHRAVLDAGDKVSGITIHYVNEKYDEGAIIFQAECEVMADDTPETLAQRIHQLEHRHYPEVVESVLNDTF